MVWLRRKLLTLLHPFLWTLGRARRKSSKLTSEQYYELIKLIKVGDVFVTRTKKNMLNILIPGFWSHAVMFTGWSDGAYECVDAVFPKVRAVDLMDLMLHVDYMAVMRPTFTDDDKNMRAADEMKSYIGFPYDLLFSPGHDAFYCSEAIWQAYLAVCPDWDFEARERLGVETVIPQDVYDAKGHFACVWDSREIEVI